MNGYLLGFDIGGTKSAVILGRIRGDMRPEIVEREEIPTLAARSPEDTISRMISIAKRQMDKNQLKSADVLAGGISCGGPLDSKAGLILSPPNLPGWDRIAIVDRLGSVFQCPFALQNDANAGALAEWKYGAGAGLENVIFITFGTGCGAGLILDGTLYAGTNDMAGECGHVRLSEYGPAGYGKCGSMEGFCSGAGLARLGENLLTAYAQQGKASALHAVHGNMTAKDIALAAFSGDELASEVFRISSEKLGYGLAMLIDILNPQAIILGGIYARCEKLIRPHVDGILACECLPGSLGQCVIQSSKLGEAIGDYAALATALTGQQKTLI